MTSWHERDDSWETVPLFEQQSLETAPQEVDALLSLLGIEPGAEVLDLSYGVGRHGLELARRGYRVTGLFTSFCYFENQGEDRRVADSLDGASYDTSARWLVAMARKAGA